MTSNIVITETGVYSKPVVALRPRDVGDEASQRGEPCSSDLPGASLECA